jgi:hypothetical protein
MFSYKWKNIVQDTPPKQTQPFFVSTEESYMSSLTLGDTWIPSGN